MLLITCHEKLGQRKTDTTFSERDVLMTTRQPLAYALSHLTAYVTAYRARYPNTLLILQVTHVTELPNEDLRVEDCSEFGIENLDLFPIDPDKVGL